MLLKDKHIMVVDDDLANTAIMVAILMREGATVYHDFWGNTALQNLVNNRREVDIILLDLMFPKGVSGYSIFDDIRQLPAYNSIPIVAVTAADRDHEMPKAAQKGFAGYISKPLNRKQFAQQVATVLAGEEIWGE